MCEPFGAYGWQFGLGEMKWLTDHACVRGVNFLVPHAFTPRYPDPDCPPHPYGLGKVAAGDHRLRVEVTTTLVEPNGDGNEFDRSMAQKPMGLLGPVRLVR